MSEKYIENHFDKIIEYESDIETKLVKASCMTNELKQCNRWFIDTFSGAGEKVVIIYSDFDKVLLKVLE